MPQQRAWQFGDICYQTGLNWRSIIHLVRPKRGRAGHYLTEVKLIFKEESVLIVLKKDSKNGAQVAFIEAETFDTAVWVMSQELKSKRLKWREDRYRTTRIDKTGTT